MHHPAFLEPADIPTMTLTSNLFAFCHYRSIKNCKCHSFTFVSYVVPRRLQKRLVYVRANLDLSLSLLLSGESRERNADGAERVKRLRSSGVQATQAHTYHTHTTTDWANKGNTSDDELPSRTNRLPLAASVSGRWSSGISINIGLDSMASKQIKELYLDYWYDSALERIVQSHSRLEL